jgi:hypothetical protein
MRCGGTLPLALRLPGPSAQQPRRVIKVRDPASSAEPSPAWLRSASGCRLREWPGAPDYCFDLAGALTHPEVAAAPSGGAVRHTMRVVGPRRGGRRSGFVSRASPAARGGGAPCPTYERIATAAYACFRRPSSS